MTTLTGRTPLEHFGDLLAGLSANELQRYHDSRAGLWTAGQLEVYERVLAARAGAGWRADPMSMALHLSPGDVEDWPYTRLLAHQVRKALTGESRFQVWNLPTQMGKSTWMQRGLLWALDTAPERTFQYLTYAQALALEASDNVRGWAREYDTQLSFDLRHDRQALNRWRTKQGGGVLFSSLSGTSSGFTATGGVFVDDPIKNWEEAHSKVTRDGRWNEIRAVAFKRLSEGAFLILAHARLHEDDPSARMHQLAEELGVEIEFVVLPMLSKGPDVDLLGRPKGEPLEPRRYSLAECQLRQAIDGSYMNAAIDGQDPQPEQGGEVLREWWKWTATPPQRFTESLTSWDMKLKDKESGDYVVGVTIGKIGARYWITDMIRGQFSQLQTKVAIAWMSLKHPEARRHIVENTGNGPEVMAELRAGEPNFVLTSEIADKVGVPEDQRDAVERLVRRGLNGVVPENVKGSKLVRARRVIPAIEGGHVTLIEGHRFSHAIVDEWASFPPKAGGHDDIVDAVGQGIDKLAHSRSTVLNQPGVGAAATPVATPGPGVRSAPQVPKARAQVLR